MTVHLNHKENDFEVNAEKYKQEFMGNIQKLNEKTANKGVCGKIRQFIGYLGQKVKKAALFQDPDGGLTWMTHLTAEHMSQGVLSGGRSLDTSKKIIGLLKKDIFTDKAKMNEIAEQLEFVKKIQEATQPFRPPLWSIITEVKKKIEALEVGKSILIPSDTPDHGMMMSIQCTANNNGKKTFAIFQYNEGWGNNEYHPKRINQKTGQDEYQVLEITDVDGEELYGKKSHFIRDVLSLTNLSNIFVQEPVKKLYEEIIPQLKGTIPLLREDPRFWSSGQLGGSCVCSCEIAFIRTQLDPSSYQEFQSRAKMESLLRMYRQIKSGWGNHSLRKLVALDVVKQLEREGNLPQLDVVKEHLQISKVKSKESRPVKVEKPSTTFLKTPAQIALYNLILVLKKLDTTNFSHEGIEEARSPLVELLNIKPKNLNPKEFTALVSAARKLQAKYKDRPLNSDQIYFITAICTVILNTILSQTQHQNDKKVHSFIDFTEMMLNRCFVLNLNEVNKYDVFLEPIECLRNKFREAKREVRNAK